MALEFEALATQQRLAGIDQLWALHEKPTMG
jgi:hypothetical protein